MTSIPIGDRWWRFCYAWLRIGYQLYCDGRGIPGWRTLSGGTL